MAAHGTESRIERAGRYARGRLEALRAAPHHAQRTAAMVASGIATAAIVGLALLLQMSVGAGAKPQVAAPAAGPSAWDEARAIGDEIRQLSE